MSGTTPTRVPGAAAQAPTQQPAPQPTQMPAPNGGDPHAADKAAINEASKEGARRNRTPSVAKPAFIMVQILDESGNPAPFDKRRVKVLAVERDANKVLEAIDAGEATNAFYLRVVVPAGSRAGIPNKPKA